MDRDTVEVGVARGTFCNSFQTVHTLLARLPYMRRHCDSLLSEFNNIFSFKTHKTLHYEVDDHQDWNKCKRSEIHFEPVLIWTREMR